MENNKPESCIDFNNLRPTDLLSAGQAMHYLNVGRGAWGSIKKDIAFTRNPVRKFYQVQHLEAYKIRKTTTPKHLLSDNNSINIKHLGGLNYNGHIGKIQWKESIIGAN